LKLAFSQLCFQQEKAAWFAKRLFFRKLMDMGRIGFIPHS